MDLGNSVNKEQRLQRTKSEAEEAVRVLLEYMGEDPSREGLSETPEGSSRMVRYCGGIRLTLRRSLRKPLRIPKIFGACCSEGYLFCFSLRASLRQSTVLWMLPTIGTGCWYLENSQSCGVFCEGYRRKKR